MRPVLPLDALDIEEAHIRLVDERRGLQGMLAAFAAHMTASDSPQLVVDERNELIERGPIAAAPGQEQSGWTRRLLRTREVTSSWPPSEPSWK